MLLCLLFFLFFRETLSFIDPILCVRVLVVTELDSIRWMSLLHMRMVAATLNQPQLLRDVELQAAKECDLILSCFRSCFCFWSFHIVAQSRRLLHRAPWQRRPAPRVDLLTKKLAPVRRSALSFLRFVC